MMGTATNANRRRGCMCRGPDRDGMWVSIDLKQFEGWRCNERRQFTAHGGKGNDLDKSAQITETIKRSVTKTAKACLRLWASKSP